MLVKLSSLIRIDGQTSIHFLFWPLMPEAGRTANARRRRHGMVWPSLAAEPFKNCHNNLVKLRVVIERFHLGIIFGGQAALGGRADCSSYEERYAHTLVLLIPHLWSSVKFLLYRIARRL